MSRPRTIATTLVLAAAIALPPASATAGPPPADPSADVGPWGKGTLVPSLGFGAGFGPDIHVLSFGAGLSYFVWHGLAVGLHISDTVYIYRDGYKNAFPGINKTSPSNEVLMLPTLQYVFLRRFRFSPYIVAGVGPVFYNHDRGIIGQWMTGAGAYIGLGGPVALNIGIEFYANFPDSKWKNAFAWDPPPDPVTGVDPGEQSTRGCALTSHPCSFNLSPHIGLVFMLGPNMLKKKKPAPNRAAPPPSNPLDEQPVPPPQPATPPPAEAPPVEAPPVEDAPPPPVEDAPPPPGGAPPPTEAPPPPGEAPPPP